MIVILKLLLVLTCYTETFIGLDVHSGFSKFSFSGSYKGMHTRYHVETSWGYFQAKNLKILRRSRLKKNESAAIEKR